MQTVKRVNPHQKQQAPNRSEQPKATYRYAEGFTIVSNTLHQLITDGELSGDTLRVFTFMQMHAKRNNRFEGTHAFIAERLSMQRPHVTRAITQLRKMQLLIKITEPNGLAYWYLDARRSFRGSAERHAVELARQAKRRDKDRKTNVVALHEATT